MAPSDQEWGKFSGIKDPDGNTWWIVSTPKEATGSSERPPALSPYLSLKNAAGFADFIKKVFNAEEKLRKLAPDGVSIFHAEAAISESIIMFSEGQENNYYKWPLDSYFWHFFLKFSLYLEA